MMSEYGDIKNATDTRLYLRNNFYDQTIDKFEECLRQVFNIESFNYDASSKTIHFTVKFEDGLFVDYNSCVSAAYQMYINSIADDIMHTLADKYEIYLVIQHILINRYSALSYMYNLNILLNDEKTMYMYILNL